MRFRRKKESAIQNFEEFLKGCNCTYDIEKEDNATIIRFEFQAGHFVASFRPQDDCVEVTYPCIASAPLSQLDLVRSKCNDRNNSNILFKFTYSIDHQQNEVNVHMSFFNNSISAEQIKHELGAAFHFQREILTRQFPSPRTLKVSTWKAKCISTSARCSCCGNWRCVTTKPCITRVRTTTTVPNPLCWKSCSRLSLRYLRRVSAS